MLSRSPFLLLPCLTAGLGLAARHLLRRAGLHRRLLAAPLDLERPRAPARPGGACCSLHYLAAGHGVGWLSAWWFLIVQTVPAPTGCAARLPWCSSRAGFLCCLGAKRMRVVPIETLEVTDELSLLEPPVPRGRPRPRKPVRPPLSPWG